MNDPRKGLPLLNAPSFEEAARQACINEISDSLKKYTCMLIYQQVFQNGLPANPGQFIVVKQPPDNKPNQSIIHTEGNA
jgi:hypothetical protein